MHGSDVEPLLLARAQQSGDAIALRGLRALLRQHMLSAVSRVPSIAVSTGGGREYYTIKRPRRVRVLCIILYCICVVVFCILYCPTLLLSLHLRSVSFALPFCFCAPAPAVCYGGVESPRVLGI